VDGIGLVAVGVVLLNLYALALVVLRAPVFRTRLYRPMVLNLGLSAEPAAILALALVLLVVATLVVQHAAAVWAVIVVCGLAWLVMLPNSAYLITELNFSHRDQNDPVPLWYDIVLVLTLALSGVANALLNVTFAQLLYALIAHPNEQRPLSRPDSWLLAAAVLVLVTVGVYFGRYIRFNSWDLVRPRTFARKLRTHFQVRGRRREAAGFCLAHTLLLAIVYLILVAPAVDIV
jgi:uncharacterized membrane protein